jgi:hypothetical protein
MADIEMWAEPSLEQRFLMSYLRMMFAPAPSQAESVFTRFLNLVLVTPSTHFTNFSLQYQLYLNDVFHRTWLARITHAITVPLVVVLMVVSIHVMYGERTAFVFNALFGLWWVLWAIIERDIAWGTIMCILGVSIWRAAQAFIASKLDPFSPMAVLVLAQTLSHSNEPMMPPRMSGSPTAWGPPARIQFRGRTFIDGVRKATWLSFLILCGCLNEWISCPRLIAVIAFDILSFFGWREERSREWKSLSRRAIQSGNPAIDFIGVGGGASLSTATSKRESRGSDSGLSGTPLTGESPSPDGAFDLSSKDEPTVISGRLAGSDSTHSASFWRSGSRGIPEFWWRIFALEIPIVAGSVVYVIAAPDAFARETFGISNLDDATLSLLLSYASVVCTTVLWFYARVLFAPKIDVATFCAYQEALLLGDIGIVFIFARALWTGSAGSCLENPSVIAGISLATLWGIIRVAFFRMRSHFITPSDGWGDECHSRPVPQPMHKSKSKQLTAYL